MGSASLAIMCPFSQDQFKPQWAYRTPAGYRDEVYLIPFTFDVLADGLLHLGFPWQLDDDAPFILRGIVFPIIATKNPRDDAEGSPGLCRIWDCFGNQLQEGLVLALGVWCQSGFANASDETPTGTNAFGFPIEPEVICSPGGTLLFDFQLQTDATIAQFTDGANSLIFSASIYGTAGNGYQITIVDPGAPNVPLSVAVAAGHVTVTLATNGASAITSTRADVMAAVNTTAAAAAVMTVQPAGGSLSVVAVALAVQNLAGGAAATGEPVRLTGTLIGVKRFKDC